MTAVFNRLASRLRELLANPRELLTNRTVVIAAISALLAAAPVADPKKARAKRHVRLEGEAPSPLDPASAFRFLKSRVGGELPNLQEVAAGHWASEFDK